MEYVRSATQEDVVMARSNAASLAAIARRVAKRREWVRTLLVRHPTLTTDEIADLLNVDRSTIRRDRAAIRNQERATVSQETS